MGEWKDYKLEDLGLLQRGRSRHRPRYAFHLFGGDYPFIQTGEIREARKFIDKYEQTYNKVGLEQSKLWKKGTLCITIAANIAELGILKFDACFPDSVLGFIPNKDKVNLDFIYYTLVHFQKELKHAGEGSVQDNINLGTFREIFFPMPLLKEQKAIAEVLSSLDDKIDLLHRQNKTLEELAQTLFRQWFIEEAKDEWKEYEIRDFATHKKVSIKPAQNPNDNFLHFSLPAFDTNKEPVLELGSDIKSNKYQVEPYSILMSKLNPKTPRVWDIYFEPEENSICSTEFQVVQPNDKELFPFISTLLKSDKVRGELSMSASGTSGSHQRVKPEDIFNISFLTPSVDKMKEFSEILEPNYLKQRKNQQQIKTLENMRDTLLPKLMSGEVRVKYE